jgi:hypothetical protein
LACWSRAALALMMKHTALHVASADGAQVVAGIGNRVLVYDAVDGDLLHALKGHKVIPGHSSQLRHDAACGGGDWRATGAAGDDDPCR